MPGPWDYEALRAHWERGNLAAERYRYRRPEKTKRARSSEVISALHAMYIDTGDGRFLNALEAMTEHGFDRPHAGTWRGRERREERVCVWRMHRLCVRGNTARQAAAMVAVMFGVGGYSFDAVTSRLRKAYQREKPTLESGEFALHFQRLVGELDGRRLT